MDSASLAVQGPERRANPAQARGGMSEHQFRCWAALLEQRTGMSIPQARRGFLATSLALRMREIGYHDLDAYYELIHSGIPGKLEWSVLVDRLTVHETQFFRHPGAIALLRDSLLPALCRREGWDGQLNLWSVGCATGEEAYTLAMVTDRFLREGHPGARFGVTGVDISLESLAAARAASYLRRRARDIPEGFAVEYCEPVDSRRFRISDALRRRVCFGQLNVLGISALPSRQMDVIYCQNLLIYFDRARRRAIVDALATHLRPGGVLILGAGEILGWDHPVMCPVANPEHVLAFRRSDRPSKGAVAQ